MSLQNLKDLQDLTSVLYQAERGKFREITEREKHLRCEIARLDELRSSTAEIPEAKLYASRRVGADILWQGWLGRNRQDLNRQLALCLAQKAQRLTALRRSHGKYLAAIRVLESARASQNSRFYRKSEDDIQNMVLLRGESG